MSSCGGAYDRGDGTAGTGASGSGRACEYEGTFHSHGESFPASDGCNTCSCADGALSCTEISCDSCAAFLELWSAALQEAKQCTPGDPNNCSTTVPGDLPCGCQTFVSATQPGAIRDIEQAQIRLQELACFGPVACVPCDPPTSGTCTSEGVCMDVW